MISITFTNRTKSILHSRVTVSKWEAREGNVASKVPITPKTFFRLIKYSY